MPVDRPAGAAPPDGGKPRSGRGDWRFGHDHRDRLDPAAEPRAGAARIDACGGKQVLSKVEQDVDHSAPDLARGSERACVVAIRPDGAPATDAAVDGPRAANGQTLNSAPQHRRCVGFDNQVNVIDLNGEVNDPKRRAARRGERGAQPWVNPWRSQRCDPVMSAERDVDGMAHVVSRSTPVRYSGAAADGLPTGAVAPTAPLRRLWQIELALARHLNEQ
jgi:hypothetical protein